MQEVEDPQSIVEIPQGWLQAGEAGVARSESEGDLGSIGFTARLLALLDQAGVM